jgi:hypothetical protein
MPSLIRLVLILALLAGLVYAAMIALVTFVQVAPHPMEEAIPASKLNR